MVVYLLNAKPEPTGILNIIKTGEFDKLAYLGDIKSDFFGDIWVVEDNVAGEKVIKYTWNLNYLDYLDGLNHPEAISDVRGYHDFIGN